MRTSIKLQLPNRLKPGVKRISLEESMHIARLNPGPGTPLSMLPSDIQQRLQDGAMVSSADINKNRLEISD